MREPVIYRTHIPETAVQKFSVIEQFDISENVGLHLFYCIIFPPVCQLLIYSFFFLLYSLFFKSPDLRREEAGGSRRVVDEANKIITSS